MTVWLLSGWPNCRLHIVNIISDVSDFVIVILSQPNKYHESLAFDLKRDIINQATSSKTVSAAL